MFKIISDLFITLFIWLLFVLAITSLFILFPVMLILSMLFKNKQLFFQTISYIYLKVFIGIGKRSIPKLSVKTIHLENIDKMTSSIVLANHTSYLDGLLLVSLNRKQIAIIKETIFKIPVLGWIIHLAGHIPASITNQIHVLTHQRVNNLNSYFKNGGNLLIFPEGKRSQNGELNPFKIGVFNLIKKYDVSVEIIHLKNIHRLFGRNKILFNTCVNNEIEIKRLAHYEPKELDHLSAKELRDQIYQLYIDTANNPDEERFEKIKSNY